MYPPEHWDAYQSRRSEIISVMDQRCHTIDWLDVQILNNEARIFANDDAVIVVTVKQYPAGATELHGLVAVGSLDSILPLIEESEDWARGYGITFACIASRPAWSRVLKDHGYSLYQTELRKDL